MSKNILGSINNIYNIESKIKLLELQPKLEIQSNSNIIQSLNPLTLTNNNNEWLLGVSGSLNGFYIDKKKK